MGKMRFMTAIVPAAAIFAALSLPAAAQSIGGGQPPAKGAPQKGAPVQRGQAPTMQRGQAAPGQRGPVTGAGAHPAYRQGPQGGHVAGRPGYAGRPAYYGRYPSFARRSFGGHYYRGNLAWDRGVWRREEHNGRFGWWWYVGGAWYFYDRRYDGPPTYISDVEFLEDPAMADVGPPEDVPPDGTAPVVVAPAPVVVAPAPVVVVPPPVVCVGPLCVR